MNDIKANSDGDPPRVGQLQHVSGSLIERTPMRRPSPKSGWSFWGAGGGTHWPAARS